MVRMFHFLWVAIGHVSLDSHDHIRHSASLLALRKVPRLLPERIYYLPSPRRRLLQKPPKALQNRLFSPSSVPLRPQPVDSGATMCLQNYQPTFPAMSAAKNYPNAYPSSHPASPTLLLIDDSITELRVLIDMLAAHKWRTVVSFDGLDGYRKAQLKQPDLILLDVRMPGIDGFGTLRRLKADPRTQSIPVIFLTAAEDKADRLAGLSLGAVDYIIKPFVSEEEVLARIGIHLELSRRLGVAADLPATKTPGHSALVAAATKLLLEQMASPPAMEALTRQLGTNEKRLSEAFQEAFQLPVFGWLREQRLKLARQLLAQTDTPIADIAAHCGYTSPANFATAFRERFECAPRDFRRREVDLVQEHRAP